MRGCCCSSRRSGCTKWPPQTYLLWEDVAVLLVGLDVLEGPHRVGIKDGHGLLHYVTTNGKLVGKMTMWGYFIKTYIKLPLNPVKYNQKRCKKKNWNTNFFSVKFSSTILNFHKLSNALNYVHNKKEVVKNLFNI